MGFWMKSTIFQTFGTLRHPIATMMKFFEIMLCVLPEFIYLYGIANVKIEFLCFHKIYVILR